MASVYRGSRRVPTRIVEQYVNGIRELSQTMQERLTMELQAVDFTDFAAGKAEVMRLMQQYCGVSAAAAGRIGAEYYRLVRLYLTGSTDYEPTDETGRLPVATDEAVRAILQKQAEGKTEEFVNQLLERLDFETRRAGLDNTAINAQRDPLKPKLQRIAQGTETCDFCLMLCSREPSRYMVEHVHANCDCKLVPVFGDWLDGYDYKAAYDRWQDALYAKAAERAKRNGTTIEREKALIIGTYEASAARNRRNARVNE